MRSENTYVGALAVVLDAVDELAVGDVVQIEEQFVHKERRDGGDHERRHLLREPCAAHHLHGHALSAVHHRQDVQRPEPDGGADDCGVRKVTPS